MPREALNEIEHVAEVYLRFLEVLRVELTVERRINADEIAFIANAMFDGASTVERAIVGSESVTRLLQSAESMLASAIVEGHVALLHARTEFDRTRGSVMSSGTFARSI
jgi:hypothetical protein